MGQYVGGGAGLRVVFIGELADETDVFFNFFPILFHFADADGAPFLL